MKKIVLLLNIIAWFSINLFASTKIDNQATVERIFNQLTATVGDYSTALPKVVIRPQKRFGASYRRSENTIFIEQAALDICASFEAEKESAIAFLLGHELTHYYQKHDWQETGFTTGFLTSEAVFQENIHHEKEADTYSAFITHLAGYNSAKILPQLLEKIYDAYELKGKQMTSYPPLAARKALANEVCKTVQGLIDIYQAGNYLYALGKYEEAISNYEYLLQYVKFKELYNNIGLCALYAVLPITRRDLPFFYPLTLDPSIPLRAPLGSMTKEELIQKAVESFSIASNYDASYFTSYLNLICAYDLNGQYNEANTLLNNVKNLAITPKKQNQLAITEGILAVRRNDKSSAHQFFLQVKQQTQFPELATIALKNQRILNGELFESNPEFIEQPIILDKIESVSLLFYDSDKMETYSLKNTPLNKQSIHIQALSKSKVYLFIANGKITKMQFANRKGPITNKNIGINNTLAEIENAYQNIRQEIIPHTDGFFLLLPEKGLCFNLNQANQVIEWGVFYD